MTISGCFTTNGFYFEVKITSGDFNSRAYLYMKVVIYFNKLNNRQGSFEALERYRRVYKYIHMHINIYIYT